jgi:hypothetical protein
VVLIPRTTIDAEFVLTGFTEEKADTYSQLKGFFD